ncbi:FixH family protein [Actinokineospora sp. 24-640]
MSARWAGAVAGVVAVALLVWLLWPAADAPTVLRADSGAHVVRLSMGVPRLGANSVRLDVTEHGRPADLAAVTVEPVMTRMGHALAPVPAVPEDSGYRVADLPLTMGGQWVLTVTLHTADGPRHVDFPLLVNG